MYSFYKKLHAIFDIEISNSRLILIEKKSNNLYHLILNEKTILELNFISLTKGLSSNIVVSDLDNNIYIFNKEDLQEKIEGFSLSEKSISDNEIVISKRISKGVYDQFIYNLFNKTINKVAFVPNLIFNKHFFSYVMMKIKYFLL